jgi:hypothetical protein
MSFFYSYILCLKSAFWGKSGNKTGATVYGGVRGRKTKFRIVNKIIIVLLNTILHSLPGLPDSEYHDRGKHFALDPGV